jgi:hypothetical protein
MEDGVTSHVDDVIPSPVIEEVIHHVGVAVGTSIMQWSEAMLVTGGERRGEEKRERGERRGEGERKGEKMGERRRDRGHKKGYINLRGINIIFRV